MPKSVLVRGPLAALMLAAPLLGLASCSAVSKVGKLVEGPEKPVVPAGGLPGAVAADEPEAALIARDVLTKGGNAADAAVALGFTLAVTLPSRAGLGGGGACLAYRPDRGAPEAILFPPVATPGKPVGDRPAAVPMLAKGMAALSARFGSQPIGDLIGKAEEVARLGVPVSKTLAQDLQVVSGPLLGDQAAASVFGPGGAVLGEGAEMLQPDLAATLGRMRVLGVDDLYTGPDAHRLSSTSSLAGTFLSLTDLRNAFAHTAKPLVVEAAPVSVAFLPPPPDGGIAAAAAFRTLQANPGDLTGAQAHALSAAVHWRSGESPSAAIAGPLTSDTHLVSLLPASTSFVTMDGSGGAVACALTMDNLFGTGRIAPGTGVLLAASPKAAPLPLLAAALAWSPKLKAFRAAVAASGQQGAPVAVADAMLNTLHTGKPMSSPVPEPGRANVVACSGLLPGKQSSCGWATDSRGSGLASGHD